MNVLKMETMQRVYESILEMRIRLENTEEFIGLAQESPVFAERFEAAGTPAKYYTVMALFDIFEYVFYLNQRNLIDDIIWERWKIIIVAMISIPKFRLVWERTELSHPDSESGILLSHYVKVPFEMRSFEMQLGVQNPVIDENSIILTRI